MFSLAWVLSAVAISFTSLSWAGNPNDPGGVVLYSDLKPPKYDASYPRYSRYDVEPHGNLRLVLDTFPGEPWLFDGLVPLKRYDYLEITGIPGKQLYEFFESMDVCPVLIALPADYESVTGPFGVFGTRRIDFRSVYLYRAGFGAVSLGHFFEPKGWRWSRRWVKVSCERQLQTENAFPEFRLAEKVRDAFQYASPPVFYEHPKSAR